jgi:hypothetical protein
MAERPRFPTRSLIASLAILADAAGVTCLFLADLPVVLKVSVGVVAAVLPIAALFFYLGERRGWIRYQKHNRDLEREVRRLRNILSAVADESRREAA